MVCFVAVNEIDVLDYRTALPSFVNYILKLNRIFFMKIKWEIRRKEQRLSKKGMVDKWLQRKVLEHATHLRRKKSQQMKSFGSLPGQFSL